MRHENELTTLGTLFSQGPFRDLTGAAEAGRDPARWTEEVEGWIAGQVRPCLEGGLVEELASSGTEGTLPELLSAGWPGAADRPSEVDDLLLRFALALFAADRLCYPRQEDQAELSRVISVVSAFPAGFRVYLARVADGTLLPLGYTGWYPVARALYLALENHPEQIAGRGEIVPLPALDPGGENDLYLFNYSMIEPLIGTRHSARLIREYAGTLRAVPHRGLAAVTVSPHGRRVAARFGMKRTGSITHLGDVEDVFCG